MPQWPSLQGRTSRVFFLQLREVLLNGWSGMDIKGFQRPVWFSVDPEIPEAFWAPPRSLCPHRFPTSLPPRTVEDHLHTELGRLPEDLWPGTLRWWQQFTMTSLWDPLFTNQPTNGKLLGGDGLMGKNIIFSDRPGFKFHWVLTVTLSKLLLP